MKKTENTGFRTSRGYQMISQQEGDLSASMEDYLEMIYRECSQNGYSRVGRISEMLHVKPSSASKMIFKLADMGYLKYDRYEIIQLTADGKKAGKFLLHRHTVIAEFLQLVGSPNVLEETELVEHSLSASTVESLQILVEFFHSDLQAMSHYIKMKQDKQGDQKAGV